MSGLGAWLDAVETKILRRVVGDDDTRRIVEFDTQKARFEGLLPSERRIYENRDLSFATPTGKRATVRIVTPPGTDGHECDVDLDDGRQFRVSIPGRRLVQGVPAVDLARDAVLDALVSGEYAPGIRHHIQLASHDPSLD